MDVKFALGGVEAYKYGHHELGTVSGDTLESLAAAVAGFTGNLTKPGRQWQGVVLHHSKTKDQQVVDEAAITRFHTSWRYDGRIVSEQKAKALIAEGMGQTVTPPWSDVGYHFIIEHTFNGWYVYSGRSLSQPGGHCKQNRRNLTHIGICTVGDFDPAPPPKEVIAINAGLCVGLATAYKFDRRAVEPHRQHAKYKTCPGDQFQIKDILDFFTFFC